MNRTNLISPNIKEEPGQPEESVVLVTDHEALGCPVVNAARHLLFLRPVRVDVDCSSLEILCGVPTYILNQKHERKHVSSTLDYVTLEGGNNAEKYP